MFIYTLKKFISGCIISEQNHYADDEISTYHYLDNSNITNYTINYTGVGGTNAVQVLNDLFFDRDTRGILLDICDSIKFSLYIIRFIYKYLLVRGRIQHLNELIEYNIFYNSFPIRQNIFRMDRNKLLLTIIINGTSHDEEILTINNVAQNQSVKMVNNMNLKHTQHLQNVENEANNARRRQPNNITANYCKANPPFTNCNLNLRYLMSNNTPIYILNRYYGVIQEYTFNLDNQYENALMNYSGNYYKNINVFLEYYTYNILVNIPHLGIYPNVIVNNLDNIFNDHENNWNNTTNPIKKQTIQFVTNGLAALTGNEYLYRLQSMNLFTFFNNVSYSNSSLFNYGLNSMLYFPIFMSTTLINNTINGIFLNNSTVLLKIRISDDLLRNAMILCENSFYPEEKEVLIKRNSLFRISNITRVNITDGNNMSLNMVCLELSFMFCVDNGISNSYHIENYPNLFPFTPGGPIIISNFRGSPQAGGDGEGKETLENSPMSNSIIPNIYYADYMTKKLPKLKSDESTNIDTIKAELKKESTENIDTIKAELKKISENVYNIVKMMDYNEIYIENLYKKYNKVKYNKVKYNMKYIKYKQKYLLQKKK